MKEILSTLKWGKLISMIVIFWSQASCRQKHWGTCSKSNMYCFLGTLLVRQPVTANQSCRVHLIVKPFIIYRLAAFKNSLIEHSWKVGPTLQKQSLSALLFINFPCIQYAQCTWYTAYILLSLYMYGYTMVWYEFHIFNTMSETIFKSLPDLANIRSISLLYPRD